MAAIFKDDKMIWLLQSTQAKEPRKDIYAVFLWLRKLQSNRNKKDTVKTSFKSELLHGKKYKEHKQVSGLGFLWFGGGGVCVWFSFGFF